VQEIFLRHDGRNPVYLRVSEAHGDYVLRSRGLCAEPSDGLLDELRQLLGRRKAVLGYHPRGPQAATAQLKNNGGVRALLNGERNGGRGRNGAGNGR